MKVRRKHPEAEAIQWDGTAENAEPIINWILSYDGSASYHCRYPKSCAKEGHAVGQHDLLIHTSGGEVLAHASYWIVREGYSKFSALSDIHFESTYEPVGPATTVHFENNGIGNVGQHIQANTINNLELS